MNEELRSLQEELQAVTARKCKYYEDLEQIKHEFTSLKMEKEKVEQSRNDFQAKLESSKETLNDIKRVYMLFNFG